MSKGTLGVKEFRDIVNRSPALVFIWRVVPGEWPVEFVSQNVKDVLGYTAKDFISGRVSWPGITYPEDVPRLEAEVAKYLEDGKMEWSQEYRLTTKSGEIRWFTDRNHAVSDSKGEITHIQSIVLDITEQKKMQEEAEDIRERFSGLFNSSKDAIGFSSLKGTLLDINDSFSDLTGYTKEELLAGKKYQDLTPKEYHEYEAKMIERILRTGEPGEYEKEYIRKDGSRVPILLTTFIVKGRDGQPIALAAIVKDVSERKKNEKAIRESEEKYRTIVENTSEFIYMIDKDFRVLSLNKSAANILGGKPHEIVGKSLLEIFPEETSSHMVETLGRIFKTGRRIPDRETTMVVGEEEYWVSASLSPVEDEAGNIAAVVGFSKDITERMRAEEALRDSEDKYRTLVENVPEFIFIIDQDLKVLSLNKSAAEFLGSEPEKIVGKSIFDLFSKETATDFQEILKNIFKTGVSQISDNKVVIDDKELELSTSLTPVKGPEGKVLGILGVTRDITESKEMEEALRNSERNYRILVENAYNGIMRTEGPKRTITYTNPRMSQMLGYTVKELVGKSYVDLVHPDEMEQYLRERRVLFESEDHVVRERRLIRKDGSTLDVILSISVIDPDNRSEESPAVGIFTDITEWKKVEKSLQESEDRYRRLVELSPDGLMIFDLNGLVTSCNPALLSLSGYSEDEILGKHFSRLPFLRMRDIPRYMRIFSRVMRGEIHQPFEISFERKDGTLGWGSISLGQLREGREVVGIQADVRDVTDRRRLEEREDSLRSLIIYDIRNKLLNMRDFLELLGQTDLSEKQEEHVHTLRMLYDDIVELMDRAR
jgi:PAS domain S-box-containing protein